MSVATPRVLRALGTRCWPSLTVFKMFRSFPVFAPRYNRARFLAHYELIKKVAE